MELLFINKHVAAGRAKLDHFGTPFHLTVASFFGPPVAELAENLHGFFRNRIIQRPAYNPDVARLDYKEIVGYFAWAIKRLMQP